ncbi:MAG TPA: DMT family transporter [Flavisolibacter sp.]|nr:DMT family transporter [Flavisolibacter sp.]
MMIKEVNVESRDRKGWPTTNFNAHLGVLLANVFLATNYSLVKLLSPAFIGPYGLNVLRAIISLVLFWGVWPLGKIKAGIQKKHIGQFILCAITGVFLNQTLFVKGLTLTSTIHAALLVLVTPVIVTIFAFWLLKERFTFNKAVGLSLGVGGAAFLILQREAGHQGADYLLGDVLIVLNATAYSFYFIVVKPLIKAYSTLHVTRWMFTIGLFLLLPFGWQQVSAVQWHLFGWPQVAALFFVTVMGTFVAYYLNAYSIEKLGASVTGAYIYTQPVFAVAIAIIFLDEKVTWQKLLSALLIFAGVYQVNRKKKQAA